MSTRCYNTFVFGIEYYIYRYIMILDGAMMPCGDGTIDGLLGQEKKGLDVGT